MPSDDLGSVATDLPGRLRTVFILVFVCVAACVASKSCSSVLRLWVIVKGAQ